MEHKIMMAPMHSMGWECPKCGAVYSPTKSSCNNCLGEMTGRVTKVTIYGKDYSEQDIDSIIEKLNKENANIEGSDKA